MAADGFPIFIIRGTIKSTRNTWTISQISQCYLLYNTTTGETKEFWKVLSYQIHYTKHSQVVCVSVQRGYLSLWSKIPSQPEVPGPFWR